MKVELLDHMGSDLTVVNAARVSFDKESEWGCVYYEDDPKHPKFNEICFELSDKDAKLIRYLAKHNHWTPFGHAFASFRIKAPIFVARQLGKHQVGLVWNEVSRRYVDSEPEFYVPSEWRKRAENVKQGSSDEVVEDNDNIVDVMADHFKTQAAIYNDLVERLGVCPEQARMVLPQSMLTEWWWSGSLAAFARVCKLRLDPHTQKETRDVAAMIDAELAKVFPVSWEALMGAERD